jgi:hypothetical protein
MNEYINNRHQNEEQKQNEGQHDHKPYWKRFHHSWGFWLFLFLTFVAVMYYIMSENFAFAPHNQSKQPTENNRMP